MDFLSDLGFAGVVLSLAGVYTIFALGLQLQAGHAGLLNFGHAGYMAIGAYTTGILTTNGVSLWVAVPLSLLTPVLAAIVIGAATLRLRADFLAITSIAFAEMIRITANNMTDLTGGPLGIEAGERFRVEVVRPFLRAARDAGWDFDRALPLLVIVWVSVLVVWGLLAMLVRTPWGRVLRAVREDEDAARALGKNAFLYRLQALCIGAAVAGAAGTLYGFYLFTVSPVSFEPIVTFNAFVVIILGGLGSLRGAVVAGVLLQFLLEGTRFLETPFSNPQEAALRFIVVGLLLMLLVRYRPQGMFGKKREMVLGE